MMPATGAMSRMKLKLSWSNSDALNCVRHTDHEKRVTIRGRGHDRLDADIATGARPILDDERLTEPLRQPFAYQARDDIGWAAREIADDQAHRPRRIGLRPRDAGHGRQRSSACGQMQKLSAGKFHFEPPSRFTSPNHLFGASE